MSTFPVGTKFFRDYFDPEKKYPLPPMLFRGEPIPITAEPYCAIPDNGELYSHDDPLPGFVSRINSISTSQGDPLAAWEILRPMQIFDTDISCIEVIAETIRLGLQSMLNELENAPEAKQYFREKLLKQFPERKTTFLRSNEKNST